MSSFLELYIIFCRALSQHRGVKYPDLTKRLAEARALSGDSLTAMTTKWYQETKDISEALKNMDDALLKGSAIPECMSTLHINDIFNDETFSDNSRKNLWGYLQGLALRAQKDVAKDDLEPAPTFDPFCESTEDQLKTFQKLASSLPPDLMTKMHEIAEGYQQKISTGEKSIAEINFSTVLADVVEAMKDVNMQEFMTGPNVTELLATLQSSAPEIVKAMGAHMPKA